MRPGRIREGQHPRRPDTSQPTRSFIMNNPKVKLGLFVAVIVVAVLFVFYGQKPKNPLAKSA
jgi:hypothetical protein